jgi:DNA-binding NtrC family response regulator
VAGITSVLSNIVLDSWPMASILLFGGDEALLEGLSQSLVALGHVPVVAHSISEVGELARRESPLLVIADRAVVRGLDLVGLPLLALGPLVLYRRSDEVAEPLHPTMQRAVLADLTLPLERNRLMALVQRMEARSRLTGRSGRTTPTETRAQ